VVGAKQGQVSVILGRYRHQVLAAGAGAAMVFASLPAGSFAQGQSETNQRAVSFLALDRSKPPESLNLPDDVKAGIEQVWLQSAKSGDSQILNEIVTELVSPKESAAFTAQTNHLAEQELEVAVRSKAFARLAYIANRSTIREIASFLTDTTQPPQKPTDVRYVSYAEMATDALNQIVTNAPPTTNFSGQDKVRTWQQWWEQNKDKYP
jgi:hypothetical protein